MHVDYLGDLRTRATHGPSNAELVTDAPVDNHGKGESFSPTDLLATSLATCMITVMGIAARKLDVNLEGTTVDVEKHMVAQGPRRVGRLVVRVEVPAARAQAANDEARKALEHAGDTCPVRLSLSEAVEVDVSYVWQSQV